MAQYIIALGREFGSGGHEIAEKLSERLGIPMYDRNMLDSLAAENNIEAEKLHKFDERNRFHGLTRTARGVSSSPQEHVAEIQFEFIKKKAFEGESFIIVGRCGETVLKGHPGLVTVFVRGDKDAKAERVSNLYNISKEEAVAKMIRHDKHRKAYHNHYSRIKWGDSRGYDLLINSSVLGVDETVNYIEDFVTKFRDSLETK